MKTSCVPMATPAVSMEHVSSDIYIPTVHCKAYMAANWLQITKLLLEIERKFIIKRYSHLAGVL